MNGLRHELKYAVSDGGALLLSRRLPLLLARDPHVGPDGCYTVRSLYFEDAALDAFRDKLAGVDRRAKYRLRRYGGAGSPILFEKKEKLGALCRKSALRVSPETARAMLRGEPEALPGGAPLLAEFSALSRAARLRPAALVEYRRMAFVHPLSRTRVTLDLDLRAARGGAGFWDGDAAWLPVLEPGAQILEVKYDDFLPAPAAGALAGLPAARMAISKYCLCLSLLIS